VRPGDDDDAHLDRVFLRFTDETTNPTLPTDPKRARPNARAFQPGPDPIEIETAGTTGNLALALARSPEVRRRSVCDDDDVDADGRTERAVSRLAPRVSEVHSSRMIYLPKP
jgi:hypothetical protein